MSESTIREYPLRSRLYVSVQVGDEFRKIAKLTWTNRDASLHIIPYATTPDHMGYVGTVSGDVFREWDFTQHGRRGLSPKVSIKPSGEVHATAGTRSARPVRGPRLFEATGDHIASIQVFTLEGLPVLDSPPDDDDLVLVDRDPPRLRKSMRVLLHVGTSPEHVASSRRRIKMLRASHDRTLYFGVSAVRSEGQGTPGVIVISGWGIGRDREVERLVFAVTQ